MLRKLALAVVAVASIAATAPASAHGIHISWGSGFHRHHHHHGFYRPVIYPVVYSCWRTVYTSIGPRRVYVCR